MIGTWVPCGQSKSINHTFKASTCTYFHIRTPFCFDSSQSVCTSAKKDRKQENDLIQQLAASEKRGKIFCRALFQVFSRSDRPERCIHLAANYTPADEGEEGGFLKPLTPSLLGLDASGLFENNANSSMFCQITLIFSSFQSRVSQKAEIEIDFCDNSSPFR